MFTIPNTEPTCQSSSYELAIQQVCLTRDTLVTTPEVTSQDQNVMSITLASVVYNTHTYILELCSLSVNVSVEVNGVTTDVLFDAVNPNLLLDCGGMCIFVLLTVLVKAYIYLVKLDIPEIFSILVTHVKNDLIEYSNEVNLSMLHCMLLN